jgi:uncharacterized membrane protein YdbT with pleckstrin-like domain
MKKPLLNILFFSVLFLVALRIETISINWILSKDQFLNWMGILTAIICMVSCFIIGWQIGNNVNLIRRHRNLNKPS